MPPSADRHLVMAERERQYEAAAAHIWEYQRRLFRVSSRILVHGVPLCGGDLRPFQGFLAVSRSDLRRTYGRLGYARDLQDAMARMFDIHDSVKVLYVLPDSPADRAGLREGDVILSEADSPANAPYRMEIGRADEILVLRLEYALQCRYTTSLKLSDELDATSDGSMVEVTTGMLRFAEKDADLAIIISHEVAHNVLGHLGLKAPTHKKFEKEADYLASYLTARAGFDITGVAEFWRRWALEHPQLISDKWSDTHPSAPERVVSLERMIEEILEKMRRGERLIPNRSP